MVSRVKQEIIPKDTFNILPAVSTDLRRVDLFAEKSGGFFDEFSGLCAGGHFKMPGLLRLAFKAHSGI